MKHNIAYYRKQEEKRQLLNSIMFNKTVNVIKNNEFAKKCIDKNYAFDLIIDGKKFEIGPKCPFSGYNVGFYAQQTSGDCEESYDISKNLNTVIL